MKTPITDTDELKGQTILNVASYDCRLIVVTETSFAVFSVDRGYDSGDEEIELDNALIWFLGTPKPRSFHDKVILWGITTEEEMEKIHEDRRRKNEAEKLQFQKLAIERERAEYTRLKAKFEPEDAE